MSPGLHGSAEMQRVVLDPHNSLLLLPDPVRKERHGDEMRYDPLFLVDMKRSGIGEVT
jgi:hypothetical protein